MRRPDDWAWSAAEGTVARGVVCFASLAAPEGAWPSRSRPVDVGQYRRAGGGELRALAVWRVRCAALCMPLDLFCFRLASVRRPLAARTLSSPGQPPRD